MDFLLYEPEDFASNESYLRYYFRLNETDISFWQTWISNHPAKLDCIINADQLISLLSLQLDEDELSQEYQRLMAAIGNPGKTGSEESTQPVRFLTYPLSTPTVQGKENKPAKVRLTQKILFAAAIITVVLGTGFYFSSLKNDVFQSQVTEALGKNLLRKVNNEPGALKFQLEDGSIITLQPGSALDYPQSFLPAKREVYLEGEAFFEVSKDKTRPFYVYCQNLVTHVLGTSFNIKIDELQGKIEVAVTTGKVEVYEKNKEAVKNQDNKSNGLILTPNQKAVYLAKDNKFESSLVDIPLPILHALEDNKKDTTPPEIIYKKPTPMSEILNSLSRDYGIEIEVENENLNNCHFSGPLPDMNLYLKLDAICQMVNASYEVKGTKILIRGTGCR